MGFCLFFSFFKEKWPKINHLGLLCALTSMQLFQFRKFQCLLGWQSNEDNFFCFSVHRSETPRVFSFIPVLFFHVSIIVYVFLFLFFFICNYFTFIKQPKPHNYLSTRASLSMLESLSISQLVFLGFLSLLLCDQNMS